MENSIQGPTCRHNKDNKKGTNEKDANKTKNKT
jgi:hypothetical protein